MLSSRAQKMINDYLNLPFSDVDGVRCPYFNNARPQQRGQLRVLAGKGTPAEIVTEAKIISIQYNHNIFDKHGLCHINPEQKTDELRRYLIDHNLGIDCSGLIVHILREHFLETKNFDFTKNLTIVQPKKIWRYLISRLRPVENINVPILADNKNSQLITQLSDLKSGDLIIMLRTGPRHKRDHVLLVTEVKDNLIDYVHARAWSSEGQYGHGVAQGQIKIVKPVGELLEQAWIEFAKTGEQNETYLEAKNAAVLEIRRLN